MQGEMVRAETPGIQQRMSTSTAFLNSLVKDRRDEAKRDREQAVAAAEQWKKEVAEGGARVREEVREDNERMHAMKDSFAAEARERAAATNASLQASKEALQATYAKEHKAKSKKVRTQRENRLERSQRKEAEDQALLDKKREQVARIRVETDPRGVILENKIFFESRKKKGGDDLRADEKVWVRQTEEARQMLRAETQEKHDKVVAESGGSVNIAWKGRLMNEKKQNAEAMRSSIQSVRDRHQLNQLADTLAKQQQHDGVLGAHYVSSKEANVVLNNPFDAAYRTFTGYFFPEAVEDKSKEEVEKPADEA